jgi:hypothetical protein
LLSNPGIPWGHSVSEKGKCHQRIGFGGVRNANAPALVSVPEVIHLYGSLSQYPVRDLNVEMAMIAPFTCYLDSDSGQLSMPYLG